MSHAALNRSGPISPCSNGGDEDAVGPAREEAREVLLARGQRQCPEIVACGCGLFRIHAAHPTHDGRHLRLIRAPWAKLPRRNTPRSIRIPISNGAPIVAM